jgi:hypothetical protein
MQNTIFELLLTTALINKYQRQRDDDGAILATKEDFKNVIDNFAAITDTQVSQLTKQELMAAMCQKQMGCEVSGNAIQEAFKKNKEWGTLVMNGRNGDDMLLGKMPNVVEPAIYEKIAEIID